MIPEKLEINDYGHIFGFNRRIANLHTEKEIGAEIVRRYNGYADQQKLIERLVEACEKAVEFLKEKMPKVEPNGLLQVLAAAQEQKEKT